MSDCWRGLNWAAANPVVWAIGRPSKAGRRAQFQLERLFCLGNWGESVPGRENLRRNQTPGVRAVRLFYPWLIPSNSVESSQLTREDDGCYSFPWIYSPNLPNHLARSSFFIPPYHCSALQEQGKLWGYEGHPSARLFSPWFYVQCPSNSARNIQCIQEPDAGRNLLQALQPGRHNKLERWS